MEILLNQIIFQIINFGIIMFVLAKFLYKPILSILDQRSQKVSQGVKAAEENLKAQEEIDTKVKQEMKKAQTEANAILKNSQKSAKKQADDIISEAKKEASKVLAKERKSLESSLEADRKKLESEFVDSVTQTSKQLLGQYLSTAEQKKIIEAQIKELKGFSFQ